MEGSNPRIRLESELCGTFSDATFTYLRVCVCSTFVFYDRGDFPFKIVKSGKTRTADSNGLGIFSAIKRMFSYNYLPISMAVRK